MQIKPIKVLCTLIGSSSRQEHRKLAKVEMSHIMATLWLKPSPAQMETPLATAIPAQLPHRAARPHQGGKRLGRHTSVTTGGGRGRVRSGESTKKEV